MEFSSMFDSFNGDRKYNSSDFAEYFASFLTNGVFNGGENLSVYYSGSGLQLKVKLGKAWINGRYYHLRDEEKLLTLEASHLTLPRIDRVVLRLDLSVDQRLIHAVVKTGTPNSAPVPPELVRDMDDIGVYEISLAQIFVPANTTEVNPANITDERLDENLCGLVGSLITADTTTIFNQFQSYFQNEVKDTWEDWFDQTVNLWNNWFGDTNLAWDGLKDDFNTWFNSIKSEIFDAVYFDYENFRYRAGHYYKTIFQPDGNILKELRVTGSDDLVATVQTNFNPDGSIDNILHVVADNITVTKSTVFEPDGNITEVII